MPYLISYDIEDNNRRLKIANRLLEAGFLRLQKSVFAGDPSESVMKKLTDWLKKMVPNNPSSTDCTLILTCTQNQLDNALTLGKPPDEWDDLLNPPNTLII
jgi:CRISPR-associated endonuclease Cas2